MNINFPSFHTFTLLVLAIGLSCFLQTSCSISSRVNSPRTPADPRLPKSLEVPQNPVELKPFLPDAPARQFVQELQDAFARNDFAAIEQKANSAINQKERINGGGWKVRAIDQTLSEPGQETGQSDDAWQKHLMRLEEWKRQFPKSITAQATLSSAYISYGAHARGDGPANTVTSEGRRLFQERLEIAAEILEEAAGIENRSPVFYENLLNLGIGQGWSKEEFDRVFHEAIKYEPEYQNFYRIKAYYLLPRWHGEPGDWERFAEDTMNTIGGKKGAQMYYQIVMRISSLYGPEFFQQNKVNWEKAREGFLENDREYGLTRTELNRMGRLANHKPDLEISCAVFKKLGPDDFDESVWQSKSNFMNYRITGLQMCDVIAAVNSKNPK